MALSGGAEERGEQLIPGIPNDITLDKITPKLPWTVFSSLALVSPAWLHAIRSHQVYNARLRAHSTETFALIKFVPRGSVEAIALYSMRDGSYYELAPVPGFDRQVYRPEKFVSCEGKLYVNDGQNVYVLNLAGQRHWKQCASMLEARHNFGCAAATNGKIYVTGGFVKNADKDLPVFTSEVYDPKKNTWTQVRPMTSLRAGHQVSLVGEELCVHGGRIYDPLFLKFWKRWWNEDEDDVLSDYMHFGSSLEVYNPVIDEWRTVEPIQPVFQCFTYMDERFLKEFYRGPPDTRGIWFTANGKLHCMTDLNKYVHDIETNSWTQVHSNSFAALGPVDPLVVKTVAVVAMDDELLALVILRYENSLALIGSGGYRPDTIALIRSGGFGGDSKEISWQKAQPSLSFPGFLFYAEDDWEISECFLMCTIQL